MGPMDRTTAIPWDTLTSFRLLVCANIVSPRYEGLVTPSWIKYLTCCSLECRFAEFYLSKDESNFGSTLSTTGFLGMPRPEAEADTLQTH